MSKRLLALSAAAMIAACTAAVSNVASATPVADALALKNAAGSDIQAVAWWGWGWGWDGYSYVPVPAYTVPVPAYTVPAPGYAVPAPVDADAIAYCARRYRTYDPDTGTYIGRYGVVRSCP